MKNAALLKTFRFPSFSLMRLTRPCFGAALLLGLTALPVHAATTLVHIFDSDFSINSQQGEVRDPIINLGDTIQWVWDSGFHSTTSVAGQSESWNSDAHFPDFTFSHTFTNPGTFAYFCNVHGFDAGGGMGGGMAGTVTVVPEPSAALSALAVLVATGTLRRRRM